MSLRDVERAMLVFKYFHEKMDLLSSLMDTKSKVIFSYMCVNVYNTFLCLCQHSLSTKVWK